MTTLASSGASHDSCAAARIKLTNRNNTQGAQMHDNPFQSPASSEFQPPNPAWGVPWGKILFWLAILTVLVFSILPMRRFGRGTRTTALRNSCNNKLFQIGQAIKAYYDDHQVFPPAYTVDENGKPLHSWRTLILPYLEQQALYDSIDLTKPWDDPVNAVALQTKVDLYQCPAADIPSNHTGYLAIVTPQSCLRPGKSPSKNEITDKLDQTVMIVEVPTDYAVPWMSPQDVDERFFVDQMQDELKNKSGQPANWPHPGVIPIVFAAGNTRHIDIMTPAAERRAMITIAGGDDRSTEP